MQAQQIIEQWERHDIFRMTEADKTLWSDGEPDDVVLAREVVKLKAEVERLRNAMILTECQYLGCGGRNTPSEIVESMRKILQDALAYRSDETIEK